MHPRERSHTRTVVQPDPAFRLDCKTVTPPRRPIDDELSAYIESRPPPKSLTTARERIEARTTTITGQWQIEEFARELRDATERAAADKLAEMKERYEEKIEVLVERVKTAERALEKAGDRRWELLLLGLTAISAAVAGHFIK